MKLLLAATIVLMLSAIAIAVPDSKQLGPYIVSFDLNANYQPQIRQSIENEEVNAYGIGLFVDNSTFATIEVAEYVEPQDATLNVHKNIMGLKMLLGGLNVTNVEDKTINGKEGFLVTTVPSQAEIGAPSTIYRAMYWLDSQGCECGPVSIGKTSVVITSTYPLDITESLLSSLQIVKGEAAASAQPAPTTQGGQVLPPA